MGIRFACHACGKRLHVKSELAGKRGVCPDCDARFRIPLEDAEFSIDPQVRPVPGEEDSAPRRPVVHGILEEDPEAAWYVRPPSGGQYGPATAVILRQWIDEGRVAASALLWREGWTQWRDAEAVLPEYADRLPRPLSDAGAAVGRNGHALDDVSPRTAVEPASPGSDKSTVGATADASEVPQLGSKKLASAEQVPSEQVPSEQVPSEQVTAKQIVLRGVHHIGGDQRSRSYRRLAMVIGLFLLMLLLVAALVYVATANGNVGATG